MGILIIIGLIIFIVCVIVILKIISFLWPVIVYIIIIAFFLLGFIAMIGSFKIIRENKKSLVQSNNKGKTITNKEKEIIELISSKYYRLEEKIVFITYYTVNPEYFINLLSKKKIFQGDNKFSCTVTTNTVNNLSRYDVEINIKYTQGFKVLMAGVNSLLESKLNNKERKVLIEIKRIFSDIIKPNMGPYEKEKAVHDYLIKTSMYDEDALRCNSISDEAHTPYGLLFNHKGVCDAYAETFQIFMYLCGIESYIVIGDIIFSSNNEYKHAWNIVKMGKYFYHVDVTFDNPGLMRFGQVDYKYFNKSDVEMEKTHIWEVMKYPFCLDY